MNGNNNTRKRLSHLCIALVATLALLISTAAHADILATGAAYGGPNTSVVACYLYNAGTTSVTISTAKIVGEFGPTYSGMPIVPGAGFDFNSCGSFPAILPAGGPVASPLTMVPTRLGRAILELREPGLR